ncbi:MULTISPECIES: LysR family transcriptional regulator [unclassified Pseudonocardia]|uniref:LysR family transcriptional regulator n=1 Tax=unclassified Pseudonocardia TaxID=2619320 RepID=UPI00094B53B5|nr:MULTISPECIES: LysR family transcriptional regulator [unclassified Pseudonocardia]
MELRQLRHFVEAARLSHFTRAAERLNVAQPALSQQVSALERELGVDLFERHGRRVVLAAAGERLLARAEVILAEVERARIAVQDEPDAPSGTTVVGALNSLVTTLLTRELPRFHHCFPQVDVAIHEATPVEMLRSLREGTIDLALSDDRLGDGSTALERRPLFVEELVVAVPTGHRLTRHDRLDPKDLVGERFVSYPRGSVVREVLVSLLRAEEHEAHILHECSTPEKLVASNLGVALVPRMTAEAAVGNVIVRRLRRPPSRTIGLFTVRGRHLSDAAGAFVNHDWTQGRAENGA